MSLHYAQENYYPISGEKFIDEGSLTAFRKGKYDKMTPVEKAFNHYLRNNFDDLDHTTEDNKNVVDKKDLSKKLNALNGKGESEEVKAEVKKDDSANNLENASGRIGVSASIEADHRAVADAASDCLSDEVWRLGWNAIGDGLKNNFVDPIADACENYREEQERQDEEFRSLSKGLAKRVGDFIEWDLNVSREISKYLPIPRLF